MIEAKTCNICNLEKDLTNFHKDKSKKDGYRNKCKICQKKYLQKYYVTNINKIKEKNKEWRENNISLILEKNKEWNKNNPEKYKEIQKTYIKNNKNKIKFYKNKYNRERKKNDPVYNLRCGLARTISDTLKNMNLTKNSKTVDILGCSFQEFKKHLESKFETWMNWENYGKYNGMKNFGWDIDHMIPTSSANTEDDVIRLNHFSNLQPLCSYTNRYIKKDIIF